MDDIADGATGSPACVDVADRFIAEAGDLAVCWATLGTGDPRLDTDGLEASARDDQAALAACLARRGAGDDVATLRLAWVDGWLRDLWDWPRRTEEAAASASRHDGAPVVGLISPACRLRPDRLRLDQLRPVTST